MSLVTGPWTLEALRAGKVGAPRNGLRVLSTFACGGGSSMGWKLAGFDLVGAVEIDRDMTAIYKKNHAPPHLFQMPIQDFNKLSTYPTELEGLDVLDGSPPCSVFSTAGNREKDWGKERVFREGQAEQRLDDLFFHYIDAVARLAPRVAVAENVKGLVIGKAKGFVKEIFAAFEAIGYDCQLFLLNSSTMGVPQRRERTFFIARRRGAGVPPLTMKFHEPEIPVAMALRGVKRSGDERIPGEYMQRIWRLSKPGESMSKAAKKTGKGLYGFSWCRTDPRRPSRTIAANAHTMLHWSECRSFDSAELARIQTFPDDYDFGKEWGGYVCGMSVPPFMMQRIGLRVANALRAADVKKPVAEATG